MRRLKQDAELVREARDGQLSAYDQLVRSWSARLLAYISARVRCEHTAEELAQETFLRAHRSLATLARPEKFGSWLLSIAHRLVLDWSKAKVRTEVSYDRLAGDQRRGLEVDQSQLEPETQLNMVQQGEFLKIEIDELPVELREVLLIYYYDQVTYKQLAEMLGVSVSTVNLRLAKARALLRSRISIGGEA